MLHSNPLLCECWQPGGLRMEVHGFAPPPRDGFAVFSYAQLTG